MNNFLPLPAFIATFDGRRRENWDIELLGKKTVVVLTVFSPTHENWKRFESRFFPPKRRRSWDDDRISSLSLSWKDFCPGFSLDWRLDTLTELLEFHQNKKREREKSSALRKPINGEFSASFHCFSLNPEVERGSLSIEKEIVHHFSDLSVGSELKLFSIPRISHSILTLSLDPGDYLGRFLPPRRSVNLRFLNSKKDTAIKTVVTISLSLSLCFKHIHNHNAMQRGKATERWIERERFWSPNYSLGRLRFTSLLSPGGPKK